MIEEVGAAMREREGSAGRLRVLWLTNIPLPAVRRRQGLAPLSRGGWLDSLAQPLAQLFPSIELVCCAYASQPPEPFEADGIRYVSLPLPEPRGRLHSVVGEWRTTVRPVIPTEEIGALISRVDPDIVHVHGTETPHSLAALRAAGDTPTLVSVQGPVSRYNEPYWDSVSPLRRVKDIVTLEFLKGRGLVHGGLRMDRAAAREKETLALAREVSGRTAWDRAIVEEHSPKARYWHIEEVLRDAFYDVQWASRARSVPVVLTTSGAAPYKGLDVLLRAFASVAVEQPCELHIAGDLVGSLVWPHLHAIERRLGLVGRVKWLGDVPPDELARLIADCTVFASASRIENSSNSVCESMLVGAPTIASRAGGVPSLIDHERDGLLVPVADHTALAAAMGRLLADPTLAAQLGEAARRRAVSRHDPEQVATSLHEAYETIAEAGR